MSEIAVWGTTLGFLIGMIVATMILIGAYWERYKMYHRVRKKLENSRAWNEALREELATTKLLLEDCRDE